MANEKKEEKTYSAQEVAAIILKKSHELLKKSEVVKSNNSHEVETGEEPSNEDAECPKYLCDADIEDCPILVGNARVNESLVVWDDDTLSADSIVNPANIEARTAREALLASADIRLEETTDTTAHEN